MALERIEDRGQEQRARWWASLEAGTYLATDLLEDYRERVGPMDRWSLGVVLAARGWERKRVRLPDGSRPVAWVVPERT